MRWKSFAENARWGGFAAIALMWFVGSLYIVASDAGYYEVVVWEDFLFAGLSLPWGSLIAGFSLREHRPVAARTFALAALGASILLSTGAMVHFIWVRPVLGRSLAVMDIAGAVGAMDPLEVLLTVEGPLLAFAAWWLLRWMDSATAHPPRRPGSLVRTR